MLHAATLPLFVVRWSVVTVLLMLAQAHGLGREAHAAEYLRKWCMEMGRQMFPSAGTGELKALDLFMPRKSEAAGLFARRLYEERLGELHGDFVRFATVFPAGAQWIAAMHLAGAWEDAAQLFAAAFPAMAEDAPACRLADVEAEKPSAVFTFAWTGRSWAWIQGLSAYQNI